MQERIDDGGKLLSKIREQIATVIVGQERLVDRLLLALLCDGHVLVEGIPGVAKTLTVNVLAQSLDAQFSRVQFTPDLLPGDLIGTLIYNPQTSTFSTERGPIFTNILLADEINRSPAKVQSALLEAMQEKQATLGKESMLLPLPFLVLATQNPIEQEGTYELPEAQVDRFMFKLVVEYPSFEEEHEILKRMAKSKPLLEVEAVSNLEAILELRTLMDEIYLAEELELYILHLVQATRRPSEYDLSDLTDYVRFGASPRASIYLARASRGVAMMAGRDSVLPDDIKAVAPDIMRHRISLTYKAEAADVTSDEIVGRVLRTVSIRQKSG
ncbi:MAG: AAA family ATPase [Planctomycetota bacterium]|jgi:MoxR-like ATPase|nr:AAA family ATPase [Planctomycetota bacterium]